MKKKIITKSSFYNIFDNLSYSIICHFYNLPYHDYISFYSEVMVQYVHKMLLILFGCCHYSFHDDDDDDDDHDDDDAFQRYLQSVLMIYYFFDQLNLPDTHYHLLHMTK